MAYQACHATRMQNIAASAAVFEDSASGQQAVYHAVILAGSLAVLAGSFVLRPHAEGLSLFGYRWPFHCWLHETFGLRCALCGMSRSFCSLAHGDIAAALRFHALGPVAFVLFCLEVPYRAYALFRLPKALPNGLKRIHLGAVGLAAAAIGANWLLYLGGLIL